MTAETIHTCSYSCERPACIRAQRDELASRLAAAPPPAAARGDVRGLVGYVDGSRLHELREGRLNIALWAESMGAADTPVYALAEGVQAGEVERCGECRGQTFETTHDGGRICVQCKRVYAALSQQPEARGVVDVEAMVDRMWECWQSMEDGRVTRETFSSILIAALTEARNG